MKTKWYLKLCQCTCTFPEQKDLIEQKWVKELTKLHMNYILWVVVKEYKHKLSTTGVSKWAGTRYFYPSEIVYSTGRNYWTPPKLAVVKTTSTMVDRLVEYFSWKINDHVNCWILTFKSNNCVTTKLMGYS